MPRPPGDAVRKLLDAARSLARERGCGAIAIREICRRAKVNPGLFHYHFKSRRAFVARVMEETYEDFFSRLSLSAEGPGSPPQRLRRVLRAIAHFARENRRLQVGMLRDAMNGDRQTAAFAAARFPRHLPIVLGLLREGAKSGHFRALPEPLVFAFLIGAISVPNVMLGLIEDHGARRPFGKSPAAVAEDLLSDAAVETRLDMLLAALRRPR